MEEEEKSSDLEESFKVLKDELENRRQKLNSALDELNFQAQVSEEIAWTTEKIRLLDIEDSDMNLDAVRDKIQKLEALQIDMETHKARAAKLEAKHPEDPNILTLKDRIDELDLKYEQVKAKNDEVEAFLQFKRRCQNGKDWINDRLHRIENEKIQISDLSMILAGLTKQENMEDSLKTYKTGLNAIEKIHYELLESGHPNSEEISTKWKEIADSWQKLEDATKARRERLNKSREQLKSHQDLCIEFARQASAFNSWYENVEENLTDPIRSRSVDEANERISEHETYAKVGFQRKREYRELDSTVAIVPHCYRSQCYQALSLKKSKIIALKTNISK